jgi:tape measure domain-containing protein
MAEIDPVVLQLRADVSQHERELRGSTRTVDKEFGYQEARVRRLEQQFKQSSGAIGSTFKGLAATIAAGFGAREVTNLVDGFTRLQNSLKVAGLEGERLAQVQERLFQLGSQYGVSVNTLADLYGNVAQAGKSLGASQTDLLEVTEAVSQSLLITGKSAAEASGATLGLVQALAAGTVRAEEYAQINEGGLRPLLEAAAASERFKGDINALRAAVYDGTVSSREFYQAILDGTNIVAGKASGATITLSGAFQALNDQLGKYLGEAGAASGATGAVAEAIRRLADNLDIIIPALATIATVMGTRMVASAVAGSNAMFALTAAMGGAATATEALAFAMNGLARTLPLLALTALVAGIGILIVKSNEATTATGQYKRSLEESGKASDRAREAAERLASAHGQTRKEALLAAQAERENTKQKLAGARASLFQAQTELKKARAFQAARNQASFGSTGLPGTATFIQGTGDVRVAQAQGNLAAEEKAIANFEASLATLDAAIKAPPAVAPVATAAAGKNDGAKKGPGRTGPTGPSLAEIKDRFQNERAQLMAQTNSALRSTARSADEVAEYELRNVELARIRTAASVKADQDYSDAQKEEILGLVERVAFVEREAVEFQKRARLEQESAELAEARYRASFESLQLQYELADTDAERQAIAVRILEAEDAFLRSKLEAVAANQTLADAERQQARIALAALNATAAQRREATIRNNETPVQRYLRGVNKTPEQINEALDNIQLDGLDALNDGLVEAIRGTRSLGDTFSSIADQIVADLLRIAVQRAIIAPLADALFPEGGATGGVFSGLFRGLFGRASGGRVEGGQIYRINEGGAPGRVEAFRPDTGGNIIPLGQMGALQASGGKALSGVVRIVIEEEPGFVARVRTEASGAAVQVVRAAAPGMLGAASAQARRDAARPAMPGGMTG